jgi:hypothetical protein
MECGGYPPGKHASIGLPLRERLVLKELYLSPPKEPNYVNDSTRGKVNIAVCNVEASMTAPKRCEFARLACAKGKGGVIFEISLSHIIAHIHHSHHFDKIFSTLFADFPSCLRWMPPVDPLNANQHLRLSVIRSFPSNCLSRKFTTCTEALRPIFVSPFVICLSSSHLSVSLFHHVILIE